jgi:hypothetical protein
MVLDRWLHWILIEPWGEVAMKARRVVAITGAIALTLGSAATAIGMSSGPRDSVSGGGWRLLDGLPIAEFELGASSTADGTAAHGSYSFSRDGLWFTGSITCLRVSGDVAVAGGAVTDGNIVGAAGFLVWIDDGGAPAGGQPGPDSVSFTLVSPDDPLWPDAVGDIPEACPSTDLPDGVEWRSVDGNVTVHDR